MKAMRKMSEREVVAALWKIEKRWPKGLAIFADGNRLTLLRVGANGEHPLPGTKDFDTSALAQYDIPNDGGSA